MRCKKKIYINTAFYFMGCIFLFSCNSNDENIANINKKKLGVEEAFNVNVNYTKGGKATAKLLSPLMVRVQDTLPFVEFPKKLHVDFYKDSGSINAILDANYGKYFETQNKVLLKDSIKLINDQGDTLYCHELWWDRSQTGHEFYTDKPVRIRRKIGYVNGTGMRSAQDFKNWVILNPSEGLLTVPSSKFPEY